MLTDASNFEQRENIVIARIGSSDMTAAEVDQIVSKLGEYHEKTGANVFILDMQNVEFLDSSCLGSLVTFLIKIDKKDGKLALANCQPHVADLISITGLQTHLQVANTVDDVINAAA